MAALRPRHGAGVVRVQEQHGVEVRRVREQHDVEVRQGEAEGELVAGLASGGFRNGLGGGLNYCRLEILLTYTF